MPYDPRARYINVDLTGLGTVRAKVVRQRKRVKGFGAEFIDLAEGIRESIQSWGADPAAIAA